MKKVYILFLTLATFASCTYDNPEEFESEEFIYKKGWDIVSLTTYGSVYNEELREKESIVRYHYNNIGHLSFDLDWTGLYTYNESSYPFTWEFMPSNTLKIIFDPEIITDYSPPFIFYSFFGGNFTTPYSIDYNNTEKHSIERLSKSSLLLKSGSSEVIISKVN